jgi:alpha-beta hydrolase superfamily lysophospholipase
MQRVIPFYLSTSRLASFLWALPLLSTFLLLACFSPRWAALLFALWGFLQGCGLLAVAMMQRKDAKRVKTKAGFTLATGHETKAVLLLHGFVDLPLAWKRQADLLAQKGYAVEVPHLDHEAPHTWRALIEARLTALCSTYRHVELWGHSMGGALALAVAPAFPLKRVVLWAPFLAPYLTRGLVATIYILHRLLVFGPRTFTFFPSHRHGKGTPTTSYYVDCTLPITTFATMLQTQYLAAAAQQQAPVCFLLAYREKVVSNPAICKRFPQAPILWAAHPSTGHQLTNAPDWRKNLHRLLRSSP